LACFDKHLTKAGYLAMGGQIVDATVIAAPKQRNTEDEKVDIKVSKIPDAWKDKPAKLRQKDRDARWTVKFSKAKVDEEGKEHKRDIAVPVFGYKNHAAIDQRHGFIRGRPMHPLAMTSEPGKLMDPEIDKNRNCNANST
jgi:hypothetical protein